MDSFFHRFANHADPTSKAAQMRRARLRLLDELMEGFREPIRLLDVGGTKEFWDASRDQLRRRYEFTLLNREPPEQATISGYIYVEGDARNLPFSDHSFDVCFSNSVIEHVGTLFDQMRMAAEVQRVAHNFFIQTPNRNFPIEPHFLFPLWQYLPLGLRAWLLRQRSFGWMKRTPDPLVARAEVEQIRLIDYRQMKLLFPTAAIYREKIGPITKSLVALGKAPR